MKFIVLLVGLVAIAGIASAQTIDEDAVNTLISGYTGGENGKASSTYLTTLATTLANSFMSSIGGLVQEATDFKDMPENFSELCDELESAFCKDAKLIKPKKKPASIVGPEIDLSFSGGACLLNETAFLEGNGDLTVDCVAPSVTVEILPATLTSPYYTGANFTDKACKLSKKFGEESDQVVFVLDKGVFDIQGLVEELESGLTTVLGQFSNLAGDVVTLPGIEPILQTVNTATSLLG